MISKISIYRECPVCGKVISVSAGHALPEGVQYIKTKRRTVVLVHTNCIKKGE